MYGCLTVICLVMAFVCDAVMPAPVGGVLCIVLLVACVMSAIMTNYRTMI